jgi:hypothetical protein
MKRNIPIDDQVNETMQSLDNLQPAKANEYLFTRIQQRIENRKQLNNYSQLMFRLAIVLIVFIGINVFSYEKLYSDVSSGTSDIEAFAADYGLQVSINYFN